MFGIRENSKPNRSHSVDRNASARIRMAGWSSFRLGPDRLATGAADELFVLFEKQ
jgi:hypothetical protein